MDTTSYTVRTGDTLRSIARRYLTSEQVLVQLNHLSDLNPIRPEQELRVPKIPGQAGRAPLQAQKIHQVQAGDTLQSIAQRYRITEEALMRANGITNRKSARLGPRLKIPPANGASPNAGKTATTLATLASAGTVTSRNVQEAKKESQILAKRSDEQVATLLEQLKVLKDPRSELGPKLVALSETYRVVQADMHLFLVDAGVKNEAIRDIAGDDELLDELKDLLEAKEPLDRITHGIPVAQKLYTLVPAEFTPKALQHILKGLTCVPKLFAMVSQLKDLGEALKPDSKKPPKDKKEVKGWDALKAVLEFVIAVKADVDHWSPKLGQTLRKRVAPLAAVLDAVVLLNLTGEEASADRLEAAQHLLERVVDSARDFATVRKLLCDWLTAKGFREASQLVSRAVFRGVRAAAPLAATADNVLPGSNKLLDEVVEGFEDGLKATVHSGVLENGKPISRALSELLAKVPADSHAVLKVFLKDFNEPALKVFLELSGAVDGPTLRTLIQASVKTANSKTVAMSLGIIGTMMSRLGLRMSKELAARTLRGLGKMIPALGAGFAFKDVGVNAAIAQDSTLPPILRCLAELTAALNLVDGVLGLIEFLGITNVDVVVQVPLGIVELLLDLVINAQVTRFRTEANRYQVPEWLNVIVAALILSMRHTGLAIGISHLELEGTERLIIKCLHLLGKLTIEATEYLSDRAAEKSGRELKCTAGLIHALADVLRYPEKYLCKLEHRIQWVAEAIGQLWKRAGVWGQTIWAAIEKLVTDLRALGQRGVAALTWLAHHPGALCELALNGLIALAEKAGEAASKAAFAALARLQTFYKSVKGRFTEGFEAARALAKQALRRILKGWIELREKGGLLAEQAWKALKDLSAELLELGEEGLELLQWMAQHPGEAAALALETIHKLLAKAGQALFQTGLVVLGRLREFYLDAKKRLTQGVDDALKWLNQTFQQVVRSALALGKKGVDALVWLSRHPDVVLARTAEWLNDTLTTLASAVVDVSQKALDVLLSAGKKVVAYVNKAIDALEKKCDAAWAKAVSALELIEWVAKHPGTVIKAVVKRAVDALQSVARGIGQLAQKATDALLRFVDGQARIYNEARAAVLDLILRWDAARERILSKWSQELSAGSKEILLALKDLKNAGAELWERITRKGGKLLELGIQHLSHLMQQGAQSALRALVSLARHGGDIARRALDMLKGSVPVQFVQSVLELFMDLEDKVRMSAFVKQADQAFKIVSRTYASGGLSAVARLIARTGYGVGGELLSALWHRVLKTSVNIVDFATAFKGQFSFVELELILDVDIPLVGR